MRVFVRLVFHGFLKTISYFLQGEMRTVPVISKMKNSSKKIFKNVKDFAMWKKTSNLGNSSQVSFISGGLLM